MVQQLPTWQDPGVEPPELLKTNGWQPGMKPSAQHMNWLFNRIYKCIKEIQAGGGTEELKQELATLQQALAMHLADNEKHVTPTDRTNWDGKAPAVHTHSIAQVIGLLEELNKKVNESSRNVANGFVGLGADGLIPASLLGGALRMMNGSYAGDGTANRFIPLGLTPKLIVISAIGGGIFSYMLLLTEYGGAVFRATTNQTASSIKITSGGIIVSQTLGNDNSTTFEYTAFY